MNYPLPPEPAANEPLRASWGAQLIRWARANTLLPTPGMILSRTPSGTSFRPQATPSPAPGAAPASAAPWQPYASLWTGSGPDPDAATRALRFRLCWGTVSSRTPGNMSDELVAFGDPTDAEIEEADAVVTQVYLQIPISETTLGQGDLTVARPSIEIIETEDDDLIDALNAQGTPVPQCGSDGSLPPYVIQVLGQVQWWGGILHFDDPFVAQHLVLALSSSGSCGSDARTIVINGI
jgi:hypothetical protein